MSTIINEKILSIVDTVSVDFDRLIIRIECPLDSGIKVECWTISGAQKNPQEISNGIRPFFQFIEEQRVEKLKDKFNVVEITVTPGGKYSTNCFFDRAVQDQAEENIK